MSKLSIFEPFDRYFQLGRYMAFPLTLVTSQGLSDVGQKLCHGDCKGNECHQNNKLTNGIVDISVINKPRTEKSSQSLQSDSKIVRGPHAYKILTAYILIINYVTIPFTVILGKAIEIDTFQSYISLFESGLSMLDIVASNCMPKSSVARNAGDSAILEYGYTGCSTALGADQSSK